MFPEVVIKARKLQRTYGSRKNSFTAVRGIDLDIRQGELFALLGTNGAGKTSTMEVLEGLVRPSAGTVSVYGCDPYAERKQVRPHVGIMLQDAGLATELTVNETARMWHGTLPDPLPIGEMLAVVDLAQRAQVRVAALSGGERRRLDFALALMGQPRILFLDEPTTGLDPESRLTAWALLQSLLDQGTTIVLTTHYLEEAEQLANRIAIMHEGKIARQGTLAEIVSVFDSRISFRPPAGFTGFMSLPELAAAPSIKEGIVTLQSRNLQVTLTALMMAARDVELSQLSAHSASLEQAFLSIAADGDNLTVA